MSNTFSLTKECNIAFYGALLIGNTLCKIFQSAGFNIVTFIDRRASELSTISGIPVVTIENIPYKEGLTVIVTTKNVFNHYKIANDLFERGVENIIYFPEDDSINEFVQIKKVYNAIINFKYSGIFEELPIFSNIPKSRNNMTHQSRKILEHL